MPDPEVPVPTEEDIELQPLASENEDGDSTPPEYRISCNPADLTLESLFTRWKNKELLVPGFQRKFVWKLPQSSKLVESFLLGLPVPPVFLFRDSEERHSVIDGQQRLKSVFYFFEGLFGDEDLSERRTVFRLKGLNDKSRFANKTYQELAEADRRRFRNSVLRAYIIDQLDPKDDTSIYHIFERLNTGGTSLKNQEVRNCVCWGGLNDRIVSLNLAPAWRAIVGRALPDRRMKDAELILRFFALADDLVGYDRPMKDFLTRYMRRHRNPGDSFLQAKSAAFEAVCESVVSTLGQKPFHVWAGLNVAVLDSVMVAFSRHAAGIPADVKSRFRALVKNQDYIDLVTGATADLNNVRSRLEIADRTLFA
jgi:hypothetical protein